MTLRTHQAAMAELQLGTRRTNVWAGMGTGKTYGTLWSLNTEFNVMGEPGRALVLAPKRVAQSTWPDEVRKWPELEQLTLSACVGDTDQRRAALAARSQDVTMNYENLPWLVETLGEAWPFTHVIADESTRLKSFRLRKGSSRAAALAKVAHTKVRFWSNLTGTPASNGLPDLWGQNWFVDAGARLGRSYRAFEDRWFMTIARPGQRFGGTLLVKDGAQAEIEGRLKDVTLTVTAKDFLDLPPLIENRIEVELPAKALKHYREMQRQMYTEIANGAVAEAVSAAQVSLKCLQIANGAAYVGEAGSQQWEPIHDEKIEALRSIIEEAAGVPVLVAYHFKSDLARLRRAFPEGRELGSDPKTIELWNAGQIPVLFAHPESAGHGLNLQHGGNILAFFGLWWNLEEHEQIIERIGPTRQAQSGYRRPVFVHYIVAKGTVDELVVTRLKTKASVQSLLIEAMKQELS